MSLTFPIQHRLLGRAFKSWYEGIVGYGESGVPLTEVLVRIQSGDGEWSSLITTLLDTGASFTLLPIELSYSLNIGENDWFEHDFYGVAQREECKVPARIARILIKLEDKQGHQSPEFFIIAAFTAMKPLVPLLGMKDCLERFNMTWNWQSGNVLLSFNKEMQ